MSTFLRPLVNSSIPGEPAGPIQIRVLGAFELRNAGQAVALRAGGKPEALLFNLAIRHSQRVPRGLLLHAIWPDTDPAKAGQSLNTLLYSLHKLLGDALGDSAPVLQENGHYWLNASARIGVDVAQFDRFTAAGDRLARLGDTAAAAATYSQAADLYRGDLCDGPDTLAAIERERLRARYMTLLGYMADYYFCAGEYATCLGYTRLMLTRDPCREDAHRLVMRCHVRQGERAQAFRQYQLCQHILRAEFDTAPEAATIALYDRLRSDPERL